MDLQNNKLVETYKFDFGFFIEKSISNWKKIFGYSFLVAVIVAGISLLFPNRYSARGTILPSTNNSALSQYSSIASLVGINLPSSGSLDVLFPDFVGSRRIIDSLIVKKWQSAQYDTLVTLYDVFNIEYDTSFPFPEKHRKDILFKQLTEHVFNVEISKASGLISITATLPKEQKLCADLVNTTINLIDIYNRTYRKSKSAEEKEFLENRLGEVFSQLTRTEEELKEFEENNTQWRQSPDLKYKWSKISREVQVQNTVWIELRKQFEFTKLNVEREKVTFDVLDYATTPTIKDGPVRSLITIFSLVFSIFVFALWFYFKDDLIRLYYSYFKQAK